eukprot:6439268-Prymnesium_polylepis.1
MPCQYSNKCCAYTGTKRAQCTVGRGGVLSHPAPLRPTWRPRGVTGVTGGHRGHRGHRGSQGVPVVPVVPMVTGATEGSQLVKLVSGL